VKSLKINLFQVIWRTNRLDGHDRDYGYIVEFKELFGEFLTSTLVER
jgi:type I site-specific restriction-modification system R (restriction) subunit